jgi:D-amino-acid dehydrogenase
MKQVVVIGAGVIGLCTAYYAARRGLAVTVLERQPADYAGCSFGNAGMVVPSHFVPLAAPGAVMTALRWMRNPESPFWIKPRLDSDLISWGWKFWRTSTAEHVRRAGPVLRDLHLASRACFDELAALPEVEFGFKKEGLLMLCKTEHALEEEAKMAAEAERLGVPAQVLDGRGAAALDPDITMDIAGAVYFPKDCHLDPARFMKVLRGLVERQGVQICYGCEVTGFQWNGTRIRAAKTRERSFHGDEFVLAGGSWSPQLGRWLGLDLPMQAGKGYSLTLPNPPELPRICSILTEARVAVTPMGASLRVGGTMEMAGMNEEINPVRVQGIIKAVPKYFPKFRSADFSGLKPWSGLRPCSPDGLPYVGRSARHPNLCVATGHAMMGLSLGPVTGRIVSELLCGESPSLDISMLNPERYN